MDQLAKPGSRLFDCNKDTKLSPLEDICTQALNKGEFPLATTVQSQIPIYDAPRLNIRDPFLSSALKDELHSVLHSGPGVFVLRNAFPDHTLLNKVNAVLNSIISAESSTTKGDHFAAGGKNARIWNSFAKHCRADPASFIEYYANPWIALAADVWLGPNYRITAQCNVVRPGGTPQTSHRDYHLGFQTRDKCAKYPRTTQVATQFLTLQGAVAHSDMPLESGPTRFLPYSQTFDAGYMAFRQREFDDYFLKNWVSVPMQMGDAVFFNPSLHHAAGQNKTADVERSANLLQISSAFGKPMETIDTLPLIECCWDLLQDRYDKEGMTLEIEAVIAALGEGYPFPTNLDRMRPGPDGLTPEDEQALMRRCLNCQRPREEVIQALEYMRNDSAM